jgi:type IV pilus assembly protein PilW
MKMLSSLSRRGRRVFSEQAGFTLVELMIAMTLTLLIVVGMIAVFLNVSRTNNEMAKVNRQIENGRFAIMLLESDIVHAGYWEGRLPKYDDYSATGVPDDAPTDVPAPCLAYTPANWTGAYKDNLLGIPIQSYDDVPTGCSSVVVNKKANTDVLVVRHAETCLPGTSNCEADTAGKLYFQSSLCSTQLPSNYELSDAGFVTMMKKDCVTASQKRKFISSIFYIRDYAVTVGDGVPTLVRSQFDLSGGALAHQAAVPLIEGIEGFRVEFGIDSLSKTGAAVDYSAAVNWVDPLNRNTPTNRGDGIPDGDFIRCTTAAPCTAAQLTNVVAAKLYVLARSNETSPGYADAKTYTLGSTTLGGVTSTSDARYLDPRYKRHLFTTTIRIANVAGRRETPP